MESEILWAGEPSHVLETWLATQAQVVPYEKELWIWANPQASPFSTRTFWRLLSVVVDRCELERVRTKVGRPGGPPIPGTLVRGRMNTCASISATTALTGTYGSIGINDENQYQTNKDSLSCVRFAHKRKTSRELRARVSGEIDMSESAREKAAKWQKHQAKDAGGVMAESISTLITGKYTKAKLADLWKLLFVFHKHGFGKNLGVKERTSLYAWKNEFMAEFPDDVLFGEYLRDIHKDYQKVKAFVLTQSSFTSGPDVPNMPWLYHHRDHVIKWWIGSAEANKFEGAKLS